LRRGKKNQKKNEERKLKKVAKGDFEKGGKKITKDCHNPKSLRERKTTDGK